MSINTSDAPTGSKQATVARRGPSITSSNDKPHRSWNSRFANHPAVPFVEAWRAYDSFLADPMVAFADEPTGIEAVWRSNTQGLAFSPKVWTDAYLAAFAELAGFEVVTFDQGFARYPSIRVAILP